MIRLAFVVVMLLGTLPAAAQERGYLAIDEAGGRHAFSFSDEADARNMCGTTGCEVVATFSSCLGVGYSSLTQGENVWTWVEAATEGDARVGAQSECEAAGGPACEVLNVYCIDAPAVEAVLGLDDATRRRIQQGLRSAGFDAGRPDGVFGPRTRQSIRQWQASRGAWASGYLTGAQVEALRGGGGLPPQVPAAPAAAAPAASAELEGLFWQSIMNSTNPSEFEAYLAQFPNGTFRPLAEARLAALRAPAGGPSGAAGARVGGAGTAASGSRISGVSPAATADARPQPGAVFRDCEVCPEMVVMADGRLALGRYEVTVGEYGAFGSATGGTGSDLWRDPGFPQTDRHPVILVTWNDAQAYVTWLSRTAGATYRLPTEAEWDRAAAGSQRGCDSGRTGNFGTCPVGSYGANGVGLSDMIGSVWEWTEDCWEGDCGRRVLRGGGWSNVAEDQRPGERNRLAAGHVYFDIGFRVARTLN